MKADSDSSVEVPCFKCMVGNKGNDCDPNECSELTEWLFNQAKKYQKVVERLRQTVKVFEYT